MKKKILIADDDRTFSLALAARLRASNYEVISAPDGLRATQLALQTHPALIILDVWMPIGIGLSVAERLAEHGLHTPIIFLTGCKAPKLRKAAGTVGAAGFIEKPYDPEVLLHTVECALSRQAIAC